MWRGTFWDCTETRDLEDGKKNLSNRILRVLMQLPVKPCWMIKMLTLNKGQIKTTVYGLVVHKFNTTEFRTTPLEKSIFLQTLCQHSLNTVPSDARHGEGKKFLWTRQFKYCNRSICHWTIISILILCVNAWCVSVSKWGQLCQSSQVGTALKKQLDQNQAQQNYNWG